MATAHMFRRRNRLTPNGPPQCRYKLAINTVTLLSLSSPGPAFGLPPPQSSPSPPFSLPLLHLLRPCCGRRPRASRSNAGIYAGPLIRLSPRLGPGLGRRATVRRFLSRVFERRRGRLRRHRKHQSTTLWRSGWKTHGRLRCCRNPVRTVEIKVRGREKKVRKRKREEQRE
jgi:hypothetical protein